MQYSIVEYPAPGLTTAEVWADEADFLVEYADNRVPRVLRISQKWRGQEVLFDAKKSGRPGSFHLRMVYVNSPVGEYPVDLLIQVFEDEVISIEELRYGGPEDVFDALRRAKWKQAAARHLGVGVCLTKQEQAAIDELLAEEAAAAAYAELDARREAERIEEQRKLERPQLGDALAPVIMEMRKEEDARKRRQKSKGKRRRSKHTHSSRQHRMDNSGPSASDRIN